MKVLLVIPSVLKRGVEDSVAADRHPTMDYFALADALRARSAEVEFLDYDSVTEMRRPKDLSLALFASRRCHEFDAVFTNSESVSITLALLLRARKRPRHVTIGHRLSTGKKQLFFSVLRVHREIDALFVYATTQQRHAVQKLRIPHRQVPFIMFHADSQFFRPMPDVPIVENQVCSVGLEWRDYPTLIEAARNLPELNFRLAAASPWSKHQDETTKQSLPSNVAARRYEYGDLRTLYAQSAFVAVPLYDNDFQAGVTTILEAMAMGKAVVATRTEGQTDVLIDGETGLYVPPGDAKAWEEAMRRLNSDAALRARLGTNARAWLEENATLTRWADTLAEMILDTTRA